MNDTTRHTGRSGDRAAWEAALTRIEDELDAHEESVRLGDANPVPEWEPPTDLGALPPDLGDRVTHLISRIQLLRTFVQYQLVAVEKDLDHLERQKARPAGSGAVSLYHDSSA